MERKISFLLTIIFNIILIMPCLAQTSLNQVISEQKLLYSSLRMSLSEKAEAYNYGLRNISEEFSIDLLPIVADSVIFALRPVFELSSPISRNALELQADRLMMRNRGLKQFISHLTNQHNNLMNILTIMQMHNNEILALENDLEKSKNTEGSFEIKGYKPDSHYKKCLLLSGVGGVIIGGLLGAIIF